MPNVTDTVNKVENIVGVHVASQEHQNYYDQQDQQYIACIYNGGLEQVKLKLAPDITLEDKEEWVSLMGGLTSMIDGIIHHIHLSPTMMWEVPTYLTLIIPCSTSQKSSVMGYPR